jgi:spermidine/putrescine ABC transporter, spermidine/putrescine-binding protein
MIKKWLAFAVVLAIALCGFAGCGGSGDEIVLNVFNWGEYISDGEGSWEYTDENGNVTEIPYLDINKAFEEYYAQKHPGKKVRVNYTTYASNEELYAKLTTSDASYDVIIPSDYLIPLLIDENLIQPIQRENIPNMDNIGEKYIVEGISYREENGERTYYSATYTFGKVGIIYNLTLLEQTFADFSQEEFEAEGWSVLWNEKYKDLGILQFNNSRDAFATAQFAMMKEDGYTGEKSYINASISDEGGRALYMRALDMLKEQQPIIQKYVMDEVFNKMETGNAAIAPYYVGDYFTMTWNCEDYELCFFYPEEGSNSFLDAMCVPTSSRNPEIAQEYINFMLSVDEDPTKSIAAINAEYICYATPNIAVQQDEHYRYFVENEMHERGYELLYSENSFDFEGEGFVRLDDATQQYLNECWDRLKIQDEESSLVLPIVCGVIAVAIIGVVVFVVIRKKKKEKYYQD